MFSLVSDMENMLVFTVSFFIHYYYSLEKQDVTILQSLYCLKNLAGVYKL